MTDAINPATLEGDDFHDWIASHLAYRHDWSTLLVHEQIHRTLDSVDGLLQILTEQLEEHGSDNDWTRRTTGMKKMAEGRMRQLNRHIEGTGSGKGVSGWKATLHEVVGLIVDKGSDELVDALESIYIPVGGLNLGDWYDRRLAKREDAREETLVQGIRAGLPMGEHLVGRAA